MTTQYGELITQAKRQQQQQLNTSQHYSKQLQGTLQAILAANSNTEGQSSSALDKITTIHQLDKSIQHQLDDGIAKNFGDLVKANRKLEFLTNKISHKLGINESNASCSHSQSMSDSLFRSAELVDQELRILENTIKIIKEEEQQQ